MRELLNNKKKDKRNNIIKDLSKEQLDEFYENKYEYFKSIAYKTVILSIVSCPISWIFDCCMVGGISFYTIFTRLFPLLLLFPYILIFNKYNYKIVNAFSYLILSTVGMSMLMSISSLNTDARVYISSLMIIVQIWFLLYGMCMETKKSILYHSIILIEVIIACTVIPEINVPLVLIIQAVTYYMIEYTLNIMDINYIDNYTMNKEVETMMIHDQLTKAYNRNKIAELCIGATNELEISRAGIMIIDIDFFKKINDNYGHETGDIVLQNLVNIISNCVRRTDYIIRWGGEEFIVLLPDCGEVRSVDIADKIRKEVQKFKENMCNATISVGVTIYNGGDYHKAIKRADKALYYCKEHGRNQVKLYDESLINIDTKQ